MNKDQAAALANLVNALRPEWDQPGIMAQLAKVRAMDPHTVALACIRAAANPQAKSPGVISVTTGEHWRERIRESEAPRPPRKGEECDRHPGEWATRCRGCAADELAADQTHPADPRRPVGADHLALARATLASARANTARDGRDDAEEAQR